MPKSQFVDPVELRKAGKITFEDIDVNVYNKTVKEERKNYSDDDLKRIYRDITILREFESMINQIKLQGVYNGVEHTYPGPAHLSIGQEAAAVGQAYNLDKNDFIFGSHRSHSEILAKALSCIEKLSDKELMDIMENFLGGKVLRAVENNGQNSVKELAIDFIIYGALAEIFARENGFHLGLGGSMHAFFQPFGIYPNNAIVGGSGTIATGAALYKKVNNKSGIVVANIGDGALARGPMWEAMTFATMDQYRQLWEESKRGGMPILFNCFNNDYGMGGQTRGETMGYNMLARIGAGVSPTQLHAERVDGYNPLAVIDAMKRKKEILLNGDGPCFLDVVTYRVAGHSPSDSSSYRTKEEIEAWKAIDPVIKFREDLVAAGAAKDDELQKILDNSTALMTKICKMASDVEKSPYIDFDKDPAIVERLMFSNEKIAKLDDREPEVLAPKEECPRVVQIKGKERFAFKD